VTFVSPGGTQALPAEAKTEVLILGDYAPWEHLAMSRDIFGCHNGRVVT
jgi:hypothetical protein